MRSTKHIHIADKLFYGIIVLLVLVLGGLGSFIVNQRISAMSQRMEKEIGSTTNYLERVLPYAAVKLDAKRMRQDIENANSEQLQVVEIFDADGERIYVYERAGGNIVYDRRLERNLVYNASRAGKMAAYFSIGELMKSFRLREFLRLVILISAVGLVLAVGLYFLVRYIIIRPIGTALSFSEGLSGGNYGKRINITQNDEMGQLQESLNKMADALEDSVENLKASFYEAESARCQALEASRLKSEFLASMSHEIRTPINAIVGFADLLLEDEVLEDKKESLKTIKKSAQILLENINDILDFSKIEAGKLKLSKSEFLLNELIEEITPIIKLRLHGKGVLFETHVSEELNNPVVCDRVRLRQVMLNILINAAKFTHRGKIILNVEPCAFKDAMFFRIEDTGIGIPKDAHESVFEPFTQVDRTITREYGGTGLGLAIAKRLVEIMGGKIWIEGKKGDGTIICFTITTTT